jgi:transposase
MAMADRSGLPIAACIGSASPHETKFVEQLIAERVVREVPHTVIADKAYDSDKLDQRLLKKGVRLVAPNIKRKGRRRSPPEDGRRLRRYRRRWKIERLFAWLQNFRRLVIRYERHAANFLGFLHLGCALILLRQF